MEFVQGKQAMNNPHNQAIKDRPQKAVGWTRFARLLWRRYALQRMK